MYLIMARCETELRGRVSYFLQFPQPPPPPQFEQPLQPPLQFPQSLLFEDSAATSCARSRTVILILPYLFIAVSFLRQRDV